DPWRDADRLNGLSIQAEYHLRMGDRDAGLRAYEEAVVAVDGIDDPQSRLAVERTEAIVAIFEGRGGDAFEIGRRHALDTPFAPVLSVAIAVEGASIVGDPDMLRVAEELAGGLAANPVRSTLLLWTTGMRALVDGDVDAGVEAIDAVAETFERRHMLFQAFEVRALAARHLPDGHPKRDEYITVARDMAERTGAPGLASWLTDMVS
ncbi:MAG TPA: hypothetical protein VLB67_13430, partial [Acidimicrobiia bacterium]|nr:hypothetical protein [Acidimicrobiia bacterium]